MPLTRPLAASHVPPLSGKHCRPNHKPAHGPRLILRLARWLLLALPLCPLSAVALDTLTLQLKWTHAFQFAGYYAAKAQGYYRDAGLEVDFKAATPGQDPLQTVLDGSAAYGVGTSSLLLGRRAGHPVVALAVIFQHSPQVLIARERLANQSIHDLTGKRLMIEPQADELLAYLHQEGVPLHRITQQAHSFGVADLVAGRTEAISAYSTNEPFFLNQQKFRYHTYTPRAAGIDFYGDTLFTTEDELRAHPQRVAAFRAASLRGWQYAMAHPEEIIQLIQQDYAPELSLDYLRFEARSMEPLLRTDLIEVGYMNPGRWRHIADTYAAIGLLPENFSLDGFLYQPNPAHDFTWVYWFLALSLTSSGIALYILRTNRRLGRALQSSRQAENTLMHTLRQREAAEAEHRQLVSLASHEFRTSASMIKSSLDSLAFLKPPLSPEVEQRIDNIRLAAKRLFNLSNTLLHEDQLHEQALQPNFENVELCQLLQDLQDSYPAGYPLHSQWPGSSTWLVADPALLRIALHNLIDNAFSHNPTRSDPVKLSLDLAEHAVHIHVSDSGPGIPLARRQQIFQRYYSTRGDTAKGIGLSIVRRIAMAHGGEIVAMGHNGPGTTMVLSLPWAAPGHAGPGENSGLNPP